MQAIHTARRSGYARRRNRSQAQSTNACTTLPALRSLSSVIRATAAVILVLVAVGGFAPANAAAGNINVWACHGPHGETAPLDRWYSYIGAPYIDTSNTCASGPTGTFNISVYQAWHPGHSYGRWLFSAPRHTSVTAFAYNRVASVRGWASFQAFRGGLPIYDSPHLIELCQAAGGCLEMPWGVRSSGLPNEDGVLLLLESCAQAGGCDAGSYGLARINYARVTLADDHPPTVSDVAGSLRSGSQLRGNASVTAQLADLGTGLYRLEATVDGRAFDARALDSNGGKCSSATSGRDFLYAVPCRLSLSVRTLLDTTTLVDGAHDVHVTVEDAAGNLATVFSDAVVTRNAPDVVERPSISGVARLGEELTATTGTWSSPTPVAHRHAWLRCPGSVTLPSEAEACTTIAGATSPTYLPTAMDAYQRLMVRVVAGNRSGTTSSVSAPTALVADSEGRTSPPPPDDGSPRDVVIVPVPQGGGTSTTTTTNSSTTTSSSMTTIIAPPLGSQPIEGLRNPVAGPGHVANGSNAGEGGRVRIAFEIRRRGQRRQVTTVRSTRNRRWVIRGRVTNAAGEPIGAAQLVAAWQTNGRWRAHTGVRTLRSGRFVYVLPKGPTRAIKFVYFAFSDSRSYTESNAVTVRVRTPVKLRVAPRSARNGRSVRFRGSVGRDLLPRGGVLVALEARHPGSRWQKFKLVRTRRSGAFAASYRFTRTSRPTRYRFRAVVARQAGYPFEGGRSRPVEVRVQP